MIQRGEIRGVTSNPTILMNAISKSSDYDDSIPRARLRQPAASSHYLPVRARAAMASAAMAITVLFWRPMGSLAVGIHVNTWPALWTITSIMG